MDKALEELWKQDPVKAFEEFVWSYEYLDLGHRVGGRHPDGTPLPIRPSSAKVLITMFGKFARFMREQNIHIKQVDQGHIESFLNQNISKSPKRTGNSRIRVKYLQILDRVFTHVGVDDKINPARQTTIDFGDDINKKGANSAREALTDEQMEAFIAALPGGSTATWRERRDGAMLAVILGGGLLPSEAIALECKDVSVRPATGEVYVQVRSSAIGQMSPDHETRLLEFARPVLLEWVEERKRMRIPGQAKRYLFPAHDGGGLLNKATLYRHARACFERAGIAVRRHGCRTLRNTFIERELASGTEPAVLQEYLGLHEIKSVEQYADVLTAKRRPVARKTKSSRKRLASR